MKTTTNQTECASHSRAILRSQRLRRSLHGFDTSVAVAFAVALADGHKRHGMAGIRAACWDLKEMLADRVGAVDFCYQATLIMSDASA